MSKLDINGKTVEFQHTAVNTDMHLFINNDHNPALCPECLQPGVLSKPTPPAKDTYRVQFRVNFDPKPDLVYEELELTKPQAEALAKAIEALIAYVQDESDVWIGRLNDVEQTVKAARKAIQAGNDHA